MSAAGPSALCCLLMITMVSAAKSQNFRTPMLNESAATDLWFAGGAVILFTTLVLNSLHITKKSKYFKVSKIVQSLNEF